MELLGIGSRINHPAFGDGVVLRVHIAAYEICFIHQGIKMVGKEYAQLNIIEAIQGDGAVTFSDAEKSLIKILKTWADITEIVPLGDKWKDGMMYLQPADRSLKPKEIPIETFFHKIVMLRDRLRVLEQRVNASPLSDEEKVNMQQYITRIYGSLTTFNVLFKNKEEQFVGDKSE